MNTPKTYSRSISIAALLLVLMIMVPVTPARSQTELKKMLGFGGSSDKVNTEFMARSSVMSLTVFPMSLDKDPNFELFPREIVTAWGKKELGFDPMKIREATLVVQDMDSINEEPGWSIVMQFEEMQGLSGNMLEPLKEKTMSGKTVFSGKPYMPSFMIFDESTIFYGNEDFFQELMTSDASGELAHLAKNSSVNGQFQMFWDVKKMRVFLNKTIEEQLSGIDMPPQIEALKQFPSMVDSIQAGLDTNNKLLTKVVIEAASERDAESLNEILLEAIEYGIETSITQMSQGMDLGDPVQAATVLYTRRMSEDYQEKLTPVVDGSTLTIELQDESSVASVIVAMMLPSIGFNSVSEQQRVLTPENNARQAALALHNYESAHLHLPTLYLSDEEGKPLLDDKGKPLMSGRVALLPFLEQNNLANQLRMDEPWDSEHNSQFTQMGITNFNPASDSRKVKLRFPVFPGSLWAAEGHVGIGDITDGTSNTIMAIEVAEEDAVEWANPEPWTISETNPMKSVFGDRDEAIATMLDGSVRILKKSEMTNKKLKAMLTIQGGEIVK